MTGIAAPRAKMKSLPVVYHRHYRSYSIFSELVPIIERAHVSSICTAASMFTCHLTYDQLGSAYRLCRPLAEQLERNEAGKPVYLQGPELMMVGNSSKSMTGLGES